MPLSQRKGTVLFTKSGVNFRPLLLALNVKLSQKEAFVCCVLEKTVWQNAQITLLNMRQFHGTHIWCYLMNHQRTSVLRLLPFSATIRLPVSCLQVFPVSTKSGKMRVLADYYLKIMWWLGQFISSISGWAYIFNRLALYPLLKDTINYSCNGRNILRYMDVQICEQSSEMCTKIWEIWCAQKLSQTVCTYFMYVDKICRRNIKF